LQVLALLVLCLLQLDLHSLMPHPWFLLLQLHLSPLIQCLVVLVLPLPQGPSLGFPQSQNLIHHCH